MNKNKEICPECLGTKKAMTNRFKYKNCKICDEEGMVEENSINREFITFM